MKSLVLLERGSTYAAAIALRATCSGIKIKDSKQNPRALRGAPLGLVISIGDRNRSFWKKPPLPWPFGPHVAV